MPKAVSLGVLTDEIEAGLPNCMSMAGLMSGAFTISACLMGLVKVWFKTRNFLQILLVNKLQFHLKASCVGQNHVLTYISFINNGKSWTYSRVNQDRFVNSVRCLSGGRADCSALIRILCLCIVHVHMLS